MEVFTGAALKDIPRLKSITAYKKRFCYNQLIEYANRKNNRKVMSIYGLRRTGKTVMMLQMINQLALPDDICFISCEKGDNIQDLKTVINTNLNCTYFFIDEVTKLADFIECASVLADKYSELYEKKIIMAGTDSLGLYLAKRDELYDRTYMIHTTYIPFKEYNYLLGKGLEDYIMYGGTLTDGQEFYNKDSCEEYTNTAIAGNIQHSLDNLGRDGEYGALSAFRQKNELTTFINKIVELYTRKFTMDIVNKKFKTHDFLSLRRYAIKRDIVDDANPLDTTRNEALRQVIMQALKIKEPLINQATDRAMYEARKYLQILDVILPLPDSNEVIFTQPGLKYCQAAAQVEILQNTPLLPYTRAERKALTEILLNDIKGRILEDIIFYQLSKDEEFHRRYAIGKFKTAAADGEFDIVCIDKETNLATVMEIKHSGKSIEQQARHLNNVECCQEFEELYHTKIAAKQVVYMGNTMKERLFGVQYVNAEDLLKEPLKYIGNQILPIAYKELAKELRSYGNCIQVIDNIKTHGGKMLAEREKNIEVIR